MCVCFISIYIYNIFRVTVNIWQGLTLEDIEELEKYYSCKYWIKRSVSSLSDVIIFSQCGNNIKSRSRCNNATLLWSTISKMLTWISKNVMRPWVMHCIRCKRSNHCISKQKTPQLSSELTSLSFSQFLLLLFLTNWSQGNFSQPLS